MRRKCRLNLFVYCPYVLVDNSVIEGIMDIEFYLFRITRMRHMANIYVFFIYLHRFHFNICIDVAKLRILQSNAFSDDLLVFTARCILKWETMRLMLIKDVISNQQQLNVFMHTCKKSNAKNIINIFHVLSNANALLNSCYLQKSRNWKDKRRHIITSRRLTHWNYWKKESKNVFSLISLW